ncbi:hypothetical protein DVDV_2049 [Desulfovibrio sp. DV]|uniref:DUF333 domain-containing protein n=1 Tax=Desulfovibrio sp. DV TaxID=1844708 RepID=UPI00094B9D9E|nr:DUF333 domain-containing protein [Desulfovibrio sp. DV]OLN27546.1 hypothetical protein DVDV_2049 [Desulfovibrio sp. DV]
MRVVSSAVMTAVLAAALAAPAAAQLVGLANPASTFCVATGGELVIGDSASGQTGTCLYAGGLAIEEWTLYRLVTGAAWFPDF